MADNPDAIRSRLTTLDYECCLWLRKNDRQWYGQNSPPVKYASMDWGERDAENLGIVKQTVETMRNSTERLRRITKHSVAALTGIHRLTSDKMSDCIPLTKDYLRENLETLEDWSRRKVLWAIHELREQELSTMPNAVKIKAALSNNMFSALRDFIIECLERL